MQAAGFGPDYRAGPGGGPGLPVPCTRGTNGPPRMAPRCDGLTESDVDNIKAVLEYEIARHLGQLPGAVEAFHPVGLGERG